MINNTNYAHWDRLKAKSFDAQFTHEMVTGLNCSPFEAEAIVEKVHEVYSPVWTEPRTQARADPNGGGGRLRGA